VVEGRKKEPERGFIALLQVLEREGVEGGQGKLAPKPKRRATGKAELDFAKLKIKNPAVAECTTWLRMAKACVSSKRLSDSERAWVAKLIELRSKFELTSLSFADEKILVRLFRTATRVLIPAKKKKMDDPDVLDIESLFLD
jgi:hypothetical protein